MCGPSAQEQLLANQEGALSTAMMNAFNDRFATQTNILGQVQDALGQLRSGNFPPGYSPSVMAALRTQTLGEIAGATSQARQAAANVAAGEGGGAASPLMSGIQEQIQGAIASTMAGKEADLLNQLTLKSYDVGRQNLLSTISGLNTLAGEENPVAFGSEAAGTTSDAFSMAKTIQQQKNQWQADLAGVATAGVSALAGGVGKSLLGGGGGGSAARTLSPSQLSMPQPYGTENYYPNTPAPNITSGAGLDVLSGVDFSQGGMGDYVG